MIKIFAKALTLRVFLVFRVLLDPRRKILPAKRLLDRYWALGVKELRLGNSFIYFFCRVILAIRTVSYVLGGFEYYHAYSRKTQNN